MSEEVGWEGLLKRGCFSAGRGGLIVFSGTDFAGREP